MLVKACNMAILAWLPMGGKVYDNVHMYHSTTVDGEIFVRLIFAAWRFCNEARNVYLIFAAQATGENFLTAKISQSTVVNLPSE